MRAREEGKLINLDDHRPAEASSPLKKLGLPTDRGITSLEARRKEAASHLNLDLIREMETMLARFSINPTGMAETWTERFAREDTVKLIAIANRSTPGEWQAQVYYYKPLLAELKTRGLIP